MVYAARWTKGWTKGQSLSACYLLASTVLVMIVVFTVEDFVFSSKCSNCRTDLPERIGLLDLSIGKTRPLVQQPTVDSPRKRSKIAAEDTKIFETKPKPNEEVAEADLPDDAGKEDEPKEEKVLNSKTDIPDDAGKEDEPKEEKVLNSKADIPDAVKEEASKEEDISLDSNESSVNAGRKPKEESESDKSEGNSSESGSDKSEGNPSESGRDKSEGNSSELAPPQIRSTWYYTKVFKHPVPVLRVLTEEDGAPRLRSNISPSEREITIVTQTSADRLPAVEATCLIWGGVIVVAVHVRLKSEFASVYEVVKKLHVRVEEQSGCRLDIQFVTEDGFKTDEEALNALYPVNSLRNIALAMAETKLIFLLDADFIPSPRLHEKLTQNETAYQELLRKATDERELFVVPAFEVAPGQSRSSAMEIPTTMDELRKRWDDRTIDCFHCLHSGSGHKPTKFEIFFDPETTEPYPIMYRNGFEPYIIGALAVIPQYDGRFRGYGENKVSHLYSCAADGMGFIVLPNVFVFEKPHPPSKARVNYVGKAKDPEQRSRIIGLYNQFKFAIAKEQKEKDPERFAKFLQTSKYGP